MYSSHPASHNNSTVLRNLPVLMIMLLFSFTTYSWKIKEDYWKRKKYPNDHKNNAEDGNFKT